MVIHWSGTAQKRLGQIFTHYLKVASRRTAEKIVLNIWKSTDSLASMPLKAPIEQSLTGRKFVYRSLVVKRLFKVVYFIDEPSDTIVIATIHDCRRDPARMAEEVNSNYGDK